MELLLNIRGLGFSPADVAGAQVHREAAGLPATVGGEAGDKLHFHWLKGLFEDACAALSSGLDALCAFIGIKVGRPPLEHPQPCALATSMRQPPLAW